MKKSLVILAALAFATVGFANEHGAAPAADQHMDAHKEAAAPKTEQAHAPKKAKKAAKKAAAAAEQAPAAAPAEQAPAHN